jgi:hypothetical protein
MTTLQLGDQSAERQKMDHKVDLLLRKLRAQGLQISICQCGSTLDLCSLLERCISFLLSQPSCLGKVVAKLLYARALLIVDALACSELQPFPGLVICSTMPQWHSF